MNFFSLKLLYICSGVLLFVLIISNYSESFEYPPEMKSLTKIIQSKNDPRIYRHISLPNQLSCILISDKDTDKSAASISVGVLPIFWSTCYFSGLKNTQINQNTRLFHDKSAFIKHKYCLDRNSVLFRLR